MLAPPLAIPVKLICFTKSLCIDTTKKVSVFESTGVKLMRFF